MDTYREWRKKEPRAPWPVRRRLRFWDLVSVENQPWQEPTYPGPITCAPTVENDIFKEPGNIYRIGSSPIQIDIINSASGIDFDEC